MPDQDEVLGLTAVADVAEQIPDDVYSTVRLEALYAERSLAGIVSAMEEDLQGKPGDTVKVPFMSRRTAQGPIAAGASLTATAESTGVHPIQLKKFGDFDIIDNEVLEDQDNFSLDDFSNNQMGALAEKVDQLVYDELESATAGSVVKLATAGDLSDIYETIVDARTELNKGKGFKASHVILGSDQTGQILKDDKEGTKKMQIVAENGVVTMIAGLRVVETSLANANEATLDAVQAIVIDQRRAVGEAWGRAPETKVDRESKSESDQSKVVSWIRYNAGELDTAAIAHVTNPSA